jgi:DHA2 family multidrug resistance protein-like MFS transporter
MALGIAMLGSVVAGVYRGLAIPPGTLDGVASHAKETLGAAQEAAGTLPADKAHGLLTAARSAFTEGLAIAAGIGSALLLASAVAVWLLVKPQPGISRRRGARSARS